MFASVDLCDGVAVEAEEDLLAVHVVPGLVLPGASSICHKLTSAARARGQRRRSRWSRRRRGEGWFVGPRCGARVQVSQREAHGFRLGSARVRENGTFSFSRAVPREARRGTRIVLDVTQFCDGVGTSRTIRIRIGRDRRGCGGPLSVDETADDLDGVRRTRL